MASSSAPKYGLLLRLKEFHLQSGITFLNHGSYGATAKRVLSLRRWLMEEMESHPDSWFRVKHPRYYMETLSVLCDFVGTTVPNTVLVENATAGLNAIVRSLGLGKNDAILVSNLTYHAAQILCSSMCEDKEGPELVKLSIKFPLNTKDDIVRQYKQCLEQHPNVKLAVIDHITSPTSVLMPIKELSEFLHERNVMVLADGAHAAGQISNLQVEDLKVDFYTGNLHKWLFTAKTSAFLWVDPKHQAKVRPAVISHFHGEKFHVDFCIRGTNDNTAYYSIPSAIDFLEELGGMSGVTKYNSTLLADAISRLTKAWGTATLPIGKDLEAPFMRLVQLPDMDRYPKTAAGAGQIEKDLLTEYSLQTLCIHFEGQLYVRLSVHVYNCLEDYVQLEKAILELSTRPKNTGEEKGYECPLMHWDLSPLMDAALSFKS